MFTKCILVVDQDVDVHDIAEVTLKVLNNIDPERDIQSHSAPSTRSITPRACPTTAPKWASTPPANGRAEGITRPGPDEIKMDAKTKSLVEGKWKALAKELGIE